MGKRIGLLGGMSAASSQLYYAQLCRLTQARCGGLTSPDLILRSVDFAPIEQWMREGQWGSISGVLIREAQMLERAGAEVIALATNTMHKVADRIQDHLTVSLVHIAEATAASLVSKGHQRPGLIATKFTIEQSLYTGRLSANRLETLVHDASTRDAVNGIIFYELCRGAVTEESRTIYMKEAANLALDGADSIILGCTEVGLLLNENNTPLPVFDTTTIHCEAIIDAAFSEPL